MRGTSAAWSPSICWRRTTRSSSSTTSPPASARVPHGRHLRGGRHPRRRQVAGLLLRRRSALRRLLPGRRVGRQAREVLGQQRRRHHGPARRHARSGRAPAGLLLHGRHLRRADRGAHRRVGADPAHQPVRRHEARGRPHDHERGGSPRTGGGLPALLQRGGRVRRVRRAPRPRVAPHPARPPGRAGQAGRDLRLRRRLPDAGWHLRPRLHSRGGPRRGPPPRGAGRHPRRAPHLQPRQRQRLLRPRGHRDGPAGHRPPDPRGRGPRRGGDPAVLVASAATAREKLGWNPSRADLAGIVADAWDFAQRRGK